MGDGRSVNNVHRLGVLVGNNIMLDLDCGLFKLALVAEGASVVLLKSMQLILQIRLFLDVLIEHITPALGTIILATEDSIQGAGMLGLGHVDGQGSSNSRKVGCELVAVLLRKV
jgi:hypothetical protein